MLNRNLTFSSRLFSVFRMIRLMTTNCAYSLWVSSRHSEWAVFLRYEWFDWLYFFTGLAPFNWYVTIGTISYVSVGWCVFPFRFVFFRVLRLFIFRLFLRPLGRFSFGFCPVCHTCFCSFRWRFFVLIIVLFFVLDRCVFLLFCEGFFV